MMGTTSIFFQKSVFFDFKVILKDVFTNNYLLFKTQHMGLNAVFHPAEYVFEKLLIINLQ